MIVKEFILGGLKFNVEVVDNIDNVGLGRTINCLGSIKLASHFHGNKIPLDSINRTFYHELTHAILTEIGRSDLSSDEQFVDSFSGLLFQYDKTKSF